MSEYRRKPPPKGFVMDARDARILNKSFRDSSSDISRFLHSRLSANDICALRSITGSALQAHDAADPYTQIRNLLARELSPQAYAQLQRRIGAAIATDGAKPIKKVNDSHGDVDGLNTISDPTVLARAIFERIGGENVEAFVQALVRMKAEASQLETKKPPPEPSDFAQDQTSRIGDAGTYGEHRPKRTKAQTHAQREDFDRRFPHLVKL